MSHEDKIWLIEAGDVLETPRPQQELPATPRPAPRPRPRTAAVVEPREPRRVVREQARPQTLHIAPLLVLTWLLGPLAVLLTPEGRRERTWAGLGVVAAVAAAILTLVPFARFHQGLAGSAPLVWMPLAFIATLGGFSAWARAVQIAGERGVTQASRLPRWLRRAPALAAAGLCAPGAGLLLAGRRRRAALALWMLWPAALAALVLVQGRGIWHGLRQAVPGPATGLALETIFIASAAVLLAGVVAWLVQALEAVRLTTPAGARAHGDWYAVALGVACAALAFTAQPRMVAGQLATRAAGLQQAEMRIIPLRMALAAGRLDPTNTAYAVQAVALCEELGRADQAEALRAELAAGVRPYLAMLGPERQDEPGGRARPAADPPRRSRPAAPQPAPAAPIEPAYDPHGADVYFGMMVAPGLGAPAGADRSAQPAPQAP